MAKKLIHTVKAGQDWKKIAEAYGMSMEELLKANPQVNQIFPGTKIRVPEAAAPVAAAGAPKREKFQNLTLVDVEKRIMPRKRTPPPAGPTPFGYGPTPKPGTTMSSQASQGNPYALYRPAPGRSGGGGAQTRSSSAGMGDLRAEERRQQQARPSSAYYTYGPGRGRRAGVSPIARGGGRKQAAGMGDLRRYEYQQRYAPAGFGDLRAFERYQAQLERRRQRNQRRGRQPGMGDLRRFESGLTGGLDPWLYDYEYIFTHNPFDPSDTSPYWSLDNPLVQAAIDARSPTQLPDTFLKGLWRTAYGTMAQLRAGIRPSNISVGDQFFLQLTDEQMFQLGYKKQPHGGWIRVDFPGAGSGFTGVGFGQGGGGFGRGYGGSRGGGGGGEAEEPEPLPYGGNLQASGTPNYGGSYSPTGRHLTPIGMGMVTWRGL